MNSFDLMIEKYSKELIEAEKKSITTAVLEDNEEVKPVILNKDNIEDENENNVDNKDVTDNVTKEDEELLNKNSKNEENENLDGSGRLKIQAFAADGVYPVVAANVKVYKKGFSYPYFEGYTDSSGIIESIVLPAPLGIATDLPPEIEPFSKYDIIITHPKFVTKKYLDVPIFNNINSIQTVQLIPKSSYNTQDDITESENENLLKRGSDN